MDNLYIYEKYKLKYFNFFNLFKKKIETDISTVSSTEINNDMDTIMNNDNELNQINNNNLKIKPPHFSIVDSEKIDDSSKTIDDSNKTIDDSNKTIVDIFHNEENSINNTESNQINLNFKIKTSSTIDINDHNYKHKYKHKKNITNEEENLILNKYNFLKKYKPHIKKYNYIMSWLSLKFDQPDQFVVTYNRDYNDNSNKIKIEKKIDHLLSGSEKTILETIEINEYQILKNNNCSCMKTNIRNSIKKQKVINDKFLNDIWDNIVIIEENLKCDTNDLENIFDELYEKKSDGDK